MGRRISMKHGEARRTVHGVKTRTVQIADSGCGCLSEVSYESNSQTGGPYKGEEQVHAQGELGWVLGIIAAISWRPQNDCFDFGQPIGTICCTSGFLPDPGFLVFGRRCRDVNSTDYDLFVIICR